MAQVSFGLNGVLRYAPALLCAATLVCPQCAGTEADNPFTDQPAEVTPCKSKEEYEPYRLSDARRALGDSGHESRWSLASTPAPSSPADTFGRLGDGLTSSAEFPIWLECVDWWASGDELSLQIVNFTAGCGAEWVATPSVASDGGIEIVLENPSCAFAGCGNCTYDVRTKLGFAPEPGAADVPVRLVQLDCNGESQTTEWTLSLGAEPSGTRCRIEGGWGYTLYESVSDAQRELFYNCDPAATSSDTIVGDRTCGDQLNCIEGRCVPACQGDMDCPLNGAFTCQDGYCRLLETMVVHR